jgi:hypothetical protein
VLAALAALGLGVSRGAAAPHRGASVPSATAAPVLIGTAREGSRLAASTGKWSGSPTSFSFQWERCTPACTPIAGATGPTYALGSADIGETIKVSVTGTNADGSAAALSAASATIAAAPAGAPKSSGAPAISGQAKQGATLSATGGGWTGTGNTYTYRWLRCDTSGSGCAEVAAGPTSTYTLTKADLGSTMRANVVAANASGSNSAVSPPTDEVAAGAAPSNAKGPSISGTPRDNFELRADPGAWTGDTPISFRYQWLRCDSSGDRCNELDGKDDREYEVRSSDEGHSLRVDVTATNAVGSSTARSDRVEVESRSKPQGRSRPTISGSTVVGSVLKAHPGSWRSTSPIDFRYNWLRCDANGGDCSTISDAGGRTYTMRAPDAGHRLRVVVLARNSVGTADWTSRPTGIVRAGAPVNTAPPAATGAAQPGSALTATPGGWSSAAPVAFSYQWSRCTAEGARCVPIPRANSRTYVLTDADVGHRLVVHVRARSWRGAGFATSRPTPIVATAAPRATSAPVVSGSARVGSTLSAGLGSWSSAAALTFSYQWARCDPAGRNCAPIPGATGQTYVPSEADAGHRLIVQVKGQSSQGTGYANSGPTGLVISAAQAPASPASVPVSALSLPSRLVIDRVIFTPRAIRSRRTPLVAHVHVSDTRSGRAVSGALVYAIGVPFNRLSSESEVQTDSTGWATISFAVRPTWPLKRGYLVVVLVRARKPGEPVLAGISTRRFVSVRVG